jgi:hypothetical protein
MIEINGKKYYTLTEAATMSWYCKDHLRRLCVSGKVPGAKKRGGRWFFSAEAMAQLSPDGSAPAAATDSTSTATLTAKRDGDVIQ